MTYALCDAAALKSLDLFFNGKLAFAKVFRGSSLDVQVLPNFYSQAGKITNVALLQFVANVVLPARIAATPKPTPLKITTLANKGPRTAAPGAMAHKAALAVVPLQSTQSSMPVSAVQGVQRVAAAKVSKHHLEPERPVRILAQSQNPNCKVQTTWLRF